MLGCGRVRTKGRRSDEAHVEWRDVDISFASPGRLEYRPCSIRGCTVANSIRDLDSDAQGAASTCHLCVTTTPLTPSQPPWKPSPALHPISAFPPHCSAPSGLETHQVTPNDGITPHGNDAGPICRKSVADLQPKTSRFAWTSNCPGPRESRSRVGPVGLDEDPRRAGWQGCHLSRQADDYCWPWRAEHEEAFIRVRSGTSPLLLSSRLPVSSAVNTGRGSIEAPWPAERIWCTGECLRCDVVCWIRLTEGIATPTRVTSPGPST